MNAEMEINRLDFKKSTRASAPKDSEEAKWVSELSALLVASVQEAKDKMSQIEYIYCSQLYPNFQNSSKCRQVLYSEVRLEVEDEWNTRFNELEALLRKANDETKHALDDCLGLKTENLELLERLAELEEVVVQKTKEVDEKTESYAKLLDLMESKESDVVRLEKQVKENEERMSYLLEKIGGLEEQVVGLNKELHDKKEEMIREKELREELQDQIELQEQKLACAEKMLSSCEEEKKQLTMQLNDVKGGFDGLTTGLKRKTHAVEEEKLFREHLVKQVNSSVNQLTKKDKLLSAHEEEKRELLSKINNLENKVEELQQNHRNAVSEIPKLLDLAKQLELKKSELSVEEKRRKDVIFAYKKLKSQQNFLLKKLGMTSEEMLLQMQAHGEDDQPSSDRNYIITPGCSHRKLAGSDSGEIEILKQVNSYLGFEASAFEAFEAKIKKRDSVSNMVTVEVVEVKKEVDSIENSDDELSGRLNQMSNSLPSSSSKSPGTTNWTTKRNSGSSAGKKRPASGWRKTRSRQSPGGADPHDDFLDTPFENIRGTIHKNMQNNLPADPAQKSKDMDSDSSDDETQDIAAECRQDKKQSKVLGTGTKSFKYVEPVRKKAERENLNGVECKQCKKFYDAVLCDAEGKDNQINRQNLRCEHHDGVSRHRYRFIPPMTPEGFWNIGFDTET